jgi:drug/metabolite transporter (DMT)-like permease
MIGRRLSVQSERGAYIALVVLTLFWGTNWIAMKLALTSAHPVIFNIERTWAFHCRAFHRADRPSATPAAGIVGRRRGHGFFQTTVNMGSTTMAVADGGAGRAAVLVFTMPFWTVLLAGPCWATRARHAWVAIALALFGLTLVVEPWHWEGELKPGHGPSFRGSAGRAGRSR